MKKIFLVLLLAISLLANDLQWSDSFFQAKQQALKEDKLILVIFTQDNCPTCEYMKDVAFEDEVLASYMQTNFVLLELDMHDKKELQKLKVYGTPTTYIFTKDGQRVGRQIVGGADAKTYLKTLKKYKNKLK